MRSRITPLRVAVVALVLTGVAASFASDVLLFPFLGAALVLLGVGHVHGWRF